MGNRVSVLYPQPISILSLSGRRGLWKLDPDSPIRENKFPSTPLAQSRCAAVIRPSVLCQDDCRAGDSAVTSLRNASVSSATATRARPRTRNTNPLLRSNRPAKAGRLRASGCIDNAPAVSIGGFPRSPSPAHCRYKPKDFPGTSEAAAGVRTQADQA